MGCQQLSDTAIHGSNVILIDQAPTDTRLIGNDHQSIARGRKLLQPLNDPLFKRNFGRVA
jgi:hypothetical protein